MYNIKDDLQRELDAMRQDGLYKTERVITSPQGADIHVQSSGGVSAAELEVINFCANNYLGLGGHPALVEAAKAGLDSHGYGLSSVRFICGTQDIHKQLERKLAEFLGMEDSILYIACFDANGGLFESLMSAEDAIVSDALNHASIIDGIRLSKAMRYRYNNMDMDDLRTQLQAARDANARRIMIATDGVFSMDGHIAPLDKVCQLADEFGAMVMIDESHSSGFMGKTGRGVHELHGVMDRIDIVTTTLGKALGGACGGATAARSEIVDYLRQKSRPYLFSNTVPPAIVTAALKVLEMLSASTELRDRLEANTERFRSGMTAAGLNIIPGTHPIVPVMLGDAPLALKFADELLEEGIYVIGFCYPVVPQGKARIRVQVSAAHTDEHIDRAIAAFTRVGKKLGVI
jgi:glycine C-acetyltransferase